jgi:hypothetical protein
MLPGALNSMLIQIFCNTHLHQGLHPDKLSQRAPTRAQGTVCNPRPKIPPRHYQGKVPVRPQAVGAHGCSLPMTRTPGPRSAVARVGQGHRNYDFEGKVREAALGNRSVAHVQA